ncbi:ABC transporter substrate-binding protein [Paenibacillus albidus]|uniref:ABC transporter substrate-binding protein n=1 Tax=Paenibacillus albidus TaxID=2041023 RepID=A0A917FTC6_9BACL|nr:ABC transporter substrate-binding protein [Paenibacillus albidus]GGG06653.1 ABC transporter substrate-binding protein [Paenibacillus albidus]
MTSTQNKKRLGSILLTTILGLTLAGCGSANTPAAGKDGEATGNTGNSAAKAETSAPVEKTLSGKLVVYSAGPEGLANKIKEGFEAKTGVTVEMFQGTTGKILARMEAEQSNPVVDVVVLASLPSMQGMKNDGLLLPYKEAVHADKLVSEWSDADGSYFSYSASALGIVYNTKKVTTPPTSWADLGKPEWKGLVNIPDPSLSGSALDFMTGYLSAKGEGGWDLFKQYKANEVAMAGANQEALDPVITGAKSVVAAGVDYMAYNAKAAGEPLDIVYPAEGTVISPRPAAIIKTSPNVDNAKAFIDYLLSDEAQGLVAKAYLLPGRTDVTPEGRASLDEITTFDVKWDWMNEHGDEVSTTFTTMFK